MAPLLEGLKLRNASLIGGLAALLLAAWAGHWATKNHYVQQIQQARIEQQETDKKEQDRLAGIAHDIGQELGKTTRARMTEREEWQRRLRDAEKTDGGIQVAECPIDPSSHVDRSSGPGWLSPQFVGLLNQSMCRGEACNPTGVDGSAGEAIGVPAGDFLIQADQNHERCADSRARLKAWQDLARRNGWVE